MMTRICSGRNILAVWVNFAILLWIAPALLAQSGTTKLAHGIEKFENGKYGEAIQDLKAAQPQLPKLADYVAFYLASSRAGLKDFAQVHTDLAPFQKLSVPSLLEPKAVLLEAKALTETGSAAAAISLLRERYNGLPQPGADWALAQAYEAAQEPAQAVRYYNRVYYRYPMSDCAPRAEMALEGLRGSMGASYPAPAPQQMLERGNRLLAARQYTKARAEFSALASQLSGPEHEFALVGMGAAEYLDKQSDHSCQYLRSLETGSPEAAAER